MLRLFKKQKKKSIFLLEDVVDFLLHLRVFLSVVFNVRFCLMNLWFSMNHYILLLSP